MTLMAGSSPAAAEWFQRATLLRKEQLGRLAALGVLVNGISRLAHMLQCERGASNVWLCSQGKLYVPECKASRGLVDENLTALHAELSAHFPVTGSGVCERIACALLSLDSLPLLRNGIDAQSITAPQAMDRYSRMLRQLLSIVPQLNDSIDDPQIAGRFVALYSLMQGKELVGQERALGAIGFTQGFSMKTPVRSWLTALTDSRPVLRSFYPIATRTCRTRSPVTASPTVRRSSSGASPARGSPPLTTAIPR